MLRRTPRLLCALALWTGGALHAQSLDSLVRHCESTADPSLGERLVTAYLQSHHPPIVEGDRVHFVYRGTGTQVAVPGEMNGWTPSRAMMTRVAGTDFFYRTEQLPVDARVEYKFWVDSVWILDPWNPRTAAGGYGTNSELCMPGYAADDTASLVTGEPHGALDTFTVASAILGRSHPVTVYTPAGYSREGAYPVLIVTDGGEYISLGKLPAILDNLIAARQIVPLVAVFVDPRTNPAERNSNRRMTDYAASEPYLDFLERELLPAAEERYALAKEPEQRTIIGASMGGLIATYAALRRPGLIRHAIAQSPSYLQADSAVVKAAERLVSSPVSLAIQAGTLFDTRTEARLVYETLRSKGVKVSYEEFPEGHNWTNWRTHAARALKQMFPPGR